MARSPASDAGADVRAVLDDFRRIVRALRLASRHSERDTGLTSAQLFVLQRLVAAPAKSINELAARTFTHQSSVSVVVRRLTDLGLVTRRPGRVDARRTEIDLTSKGRALVADRRAPAQAELIVALSKLSPQALRGMASGLRSLVNAMGLEAQRAAMFFEEDSPRGQRQG